MCGLATYWNRDTVKSSGKICFVLCSVQGAVRVCSDLHPTWPLSVFGGDSVFLLRSHVSLFSVLSLTYLQEWSSREFYQPSLHNTEEFWWLLANRHKMLAGTVCHHWGIPWSVGKETERTFQWYTKWLLEQTKKGMERIQMNLNNDAYLVNSDFPNEKIWALFVEFSFQ